MTKSQKLPERWPCVFRTAFLRQVVDPRVQSAWLKYEGKSAPFGALRTLWREHHCRTINPYGSDSCPYPEQDCALAFLQVVQQTTASAITHPRNPRGWFANYARQSGIERADNKPLARDRVMRTDVSQGPGDVGRSGSGPAAGRDLDAEGGSGTETGLHRTNTRPQRIGELLGALDPRTRQRPTTNGSESKQ